MICSALVPFNIQVLDAPIAVPASPPGVQGVPGRLEGSMRSIFVVLGITAEIMTKTERMEASRRPGSALGGSKA